MLVDEVMLGMISETINLLTPITYLPIFLNSVKLNYLIYVADGWFGFSWTAV